MCHFLLTLDVHSVQLVYSIMNQQQQQQGPPNPLPQSPGAQQNQAGVQVVMLVQDPQALGNFRASGIILGQGQVESTFKFPFLTSLFDLDTAVSSFLLVPRLAMRI